MDIVGTSIAIAEVAFKGTCIAIKTFRNGLNFSKDAERLVLGLEVERFRLHIWGENAGLAPMDGQPATLSHRLLPICDILKDYLEQIERLVEDVNGLSSRYGLLQTEEPPTKSVLVWQLVDRMQRSIQKSGIKLARLKGCGNEDDKEGEEEDDQDTPDETLGIDDLSFTKEKRITTTWKKVRWAIRDLEKFDRLVKDVAERINKLNELMTETQQRKTREDNHRVNMVVVGSAIDEQSLELIRAAVRGEPDTSQMRTAVERKALTVTSAHPEHTSTRLQPRHVSISTTPPQPLSLNDFVLPRDFADLKRFVTIKQSNPPSGPYYLLERKTYDANIQPDDMARLTSRIQRLVMLLQKPKSPDFTTPLAEGCISDPTRSCWWLVFRFPLHPLPDMNPTLTRRLLLTKARDGSLPISLLTLLSPHTKFRPPLELRLRLASTLCTTLSELYLSGWLHKGIRADNILFPAAGAILQPSSSHPPPTAAAEMARILAAPLVCGFDYSRHESEWATIDKARTAGGDVGAAMYRHPNYQGEAAQGYKVQYDIYAVGLVLVEIALWTPLGAFLEGKRASTTRSSGVVGDGSKGGFQLGVLPGKSAVEVVELSGDMKVFYRPHAVELRKRVAARAEAEMAFRVGSPYCRVVQFCLEFADRQPDVGSVDVGEVGVHPAMEFYNNVVVPLAGLSLPRGM